jgi:hypothetical protein
MNSPLRVPTSVELVPMSHRPPDQTPPFSLPRKSTSPFTGPSPPLFRPKQSSRSPRISLPSNHGWTLRVSFPFIRLLPELPRLFPTNHPLPLVCSNPPLPSDDWLESEVNSDERTTSSEERVKSSLSGYRSVLKIWPRELRPDETASPKEHLRNSLPPTSPQRNGPPTGPPSRL